MASCGEISCDQCNDERKLLAIAVLKAHKCQYDNTSATDCLLDKGDSCSQWKTGHCVYMDKCGCPACILARLILSD